MKDRFEIKILSDSANFKLSDIDGKEYDIDIWPKRSAEYFANLFYDGAIKRKDTEANVIGLIRRDLGEALCKVALFENYGLFNCSTPNTGESRNLEIFPRAFAEWLAKCLESRPKTKVEYEIFDDTAAS